MPDKGSAVPSLSDFLLGDNQTVDGGEQSNSLLQDLNPTEAEEQLDVEIKEFQKQKDSRSVKILQPYPMPSLQEEPSLALHVANTATGAVFGAFSDTFYGMTDLTAHSINYAKNKEKNPEKYEATRAEITKNTMVNSAKSQKAIQDFMPTYAEYDDSFMASVLPSAVGSIAAFWMTGLLTGAASVATAPAKGASLLARAAARMPTIGATGKTATNIATGLGASFTGAGMGSVSLGREAFVGSKGNIDTTRTAQMFGGLIGLSEGIPMAFAYKRAAKILGKTVKNPTIQQEIADFLRVLSKKGVKGAVYEGLEETTQEFGQAFFENLTARELWDESRNLWEHTVEGGAAGFITGFSLQLVLSALGAKAHLNMLSPEARRSLKAAAEFTEGQPNATDTEEEIEHKMIGKGTDQILGFLTDINISSNPKVVAQNYDMELSESAQAESDHYLAQDIKKAVDQLPEGANLMHAMWQFGKARINSYKANMNAENPNDLYVIPGLEEADQIAGMNPEALDKLSKKIQNSVVTKAIPFEVAKELELQNTDLPTEAWPDYITAAALHVKGSGLDILDTKWNGVNQHTREILRKKLEAYNNPELKTTAKLAGFTAPILKSGKEIKEAILKPTVDEMAAEESLDNENEMREVTGITATAGTPMSQADVEGLHFEVEPGGFINHSGGALGADSAWDELSPENVENKHYYYGNKTPKGNVELTESQLQEGIGKMREAAAILKKNPQKQSTINLLARNWFQVKNSTQVNAIAPLAEDMKTVEGGTGWAVAMAQADGNKEINVFNLNDNTWYQWNGEIFTKSDTPTLQPNFAGIGSRNITDTGKQAIKDVYEKQLYKEADQIYAADEIQVNGAKTIGDALEQFSGTSTAEFQKFLDGSGLPDGGVGLLTKELSALFPFAAVVIAPVINPKTGREERASYFKGTITINPNTKLADLGQVNRTYAHEMMHLFVQDYLNSGSPKALEFEQKVLGVRDELQRAIREGKVAPLPKAYFAAGAHEFLSYTFANQGELRTAMASVPFGPATKQATNETLWTRFLKYIMTAFKEKITRNAGDPGDANSLLGQLKIIMDQYSPHITAFHEGGHSQLEVNMALAKEKNISSMRPHFGTNNAIKLQDDLDTGQVEDQDDDTVEDNDILESFSNSMSSSLGMPVGDYLQTVKALDLDGMKTLLEEADKASDGAIERQLRMIYDSKYKKYRKYDDFKERFLTQKLRDVKLKGPKTFLSLVLESQEDEQDGKKEVIFNIRSYGSVSFRTPDGTLRSSFEKESPLERLLGPLEEIIGLPAGSMEIAYVNDFNVDGQAMGLDKVTRHTMGQGDSTGKPVSLMIAEKLERKTDQEGNRYIYLGNFAGKKTFPVIKVTDEIYRQVEQRMDAVYKLYMEKIHQDGKQRKMSPYLLSATMRNYISDLWLGAVNPQDGTIITERSMMNEDYNKWMKRGGIFTQDLTHPLMDPSLIKALGIEVKPENSGFSPETAYQSSKYNGIRLREDGELLVKTAVFNVEDSFMTDMILESVEEGALENMMSINKLGTSVFDGATFYVFDSFDTVYKKLHGSQKNGALKNVYVSDFGENPLFMKHAMHGVSSNSAIGRFMIENKIGLLASSDATKVGVGPEGSNAAYKFNEQFELKMKNFLQIKEENDKHLDRGALKQLLNGSGLVKWNQAIKNIDPNNDLVQASIDFSVRAANNLNEEFTSMEDQDFFDIVESIVFNPKSYEDTVLSNAFRPVLNIPIDEAKAKFTSIIDDPTIAQQLNMRLANIAGAIFESKAAGFRSALIPDSGYGAIDQVLNPISRAWKMGLINQPLSDEAFAKAVPDRDIRYEIKNIIAIEQALTQARKPEEKADLKEKLTTAKAKLKELNGGKSYKSITDFVKESEANKQAYVDARVDSQTGRLKDGFIVISQDMAKEFGIRPGDKVLTIITPTDSMLGVGAVEVAGIAPVYGANQAMNENSVIMHSEYIQSMVGKDFDIDTISVIPYNKQWDEKSWKSYTRVLKDLKVEYVKEMVNSYRKVLGDNSITGVDLFNPNTSKKIMVDYAAKILGRSDPAGRKFHPFNDFHELADKYLFDKSSIITERLKHTAYSAIGFEFKANGRRYNINHTNWFNVHNLHLIMTNHAVDAPANTSIFEYNGDLSKQEAKDELFQYTWDFKGNRDGWDNKLGVAEQQTLNAIWQVYFNRAIKLAARKDIISGESLDFFGQIQMLAEQKMIFNWIEQGKPGHAPLTAAVVKHLRKVEAEKSVLGKTEKQLLKREEVLKQKIRFAIKTIPTIQIEDLYAYPQFAKIKAMDPMGAQNDGATPWPIKGMTFHQFMQVERSTLRFLVDTYPEIRRAYERAEIVYKGHSQLELTEAIDFFIRTKDGSHSKLNSINRQAVSIAIAQDEKADTSHAVGAGTYVSEKERKELENLTDQELREKIRDGKKIPGVLEEKELPVAVIRKNAAARAKVWEDLFKIIMLSPKVDFNERKQPLETTIDGEVYKIFKGFDGTVKFSINDNIIDNQKIIDRGSDLAVKMNDFLFGTKGENMANPEHPKSWQRRKILNAYIPLQRNTNIDERKELLREFIQDNVYGANSELSRSEQMAFWIGSALQVENEFETASFNFIINKDKGGLDRNPTNYQHNALFKELLAEFEPEFLGRFLETQGYKMKTLAINSTKAYLNHRFDTNDGAGILYESDVDEVNIDTPKYHFFDKYLTNTETGQPVMKPKQSTARAFVKFRRLLKNEGYSAGFKELQALGADISTRMGFAENGINSQDMLKDMQKLSESAFRKKYAQTNTSEIDKSIAAHAARQAKILLEEFTPADANAPTDQELNNMESFFWTSHMMAQNYRTKNEPRGHKAFNKMVNDLRAFSFTGPDREVKNFAFHDDEEKIDYMLDLSMKSKNGSRAITVRQIRQRMKDYPTRMKNATGEVSLALLKNEVLSEQMKFMMNEMDDRLQDTDLGVNIIINYAGTNGKKNRDDYINTQRGRRSNRTVKWVSEQIENYNGKNADSGSSHSEMEAINALAKDLYATHQIFLERQADGTIAYKIENTTYNTITEFAKAAGQRAFGVNVTGRENLRMLGAINIRYMLDIQAKNLMRNARNHLHTIRNEFIKFDDKDSISHINQLLKRFDAEVGSMGLDTDLSEEVTDNTQHGNYIPRFYDKLSIDFLAKKRLTGSLKSAKEKEVRHNQRLLSRNDPAADASIANMTQADIADFVKHKAAEQEFEMRVNSPVGPTSENFLSLTAEESQGNLRLNDISIYNEYIDNITMHVKNDLTTAQALIFKRRAIAAGNKGWLVSEGMDWFSDQVSNKYLASKSTNLSEIKKGQEINFMIDTFQQEDGQPGIKEMPSSVSGAVVSVDQEKNILKLYVNENDIKRTATARVEKYEQYAGQLATSDMAGIALPINENTIGMVAEAGNLQSYGYLSEAEVQHMNTSLLAAYQGMQMGYERVIANPQKYGEYNLKKVRITDNNGKTHVGTHVNRFALRGITGYAEAMGRERGNAAVIDGTPLGVVEKLGWTIMKNLGIATDKVKHTLNWFIMGGFSGVPAFFVNYLGAYKSNRIDDWRANTRRIKEFNKILNRIKVTPVADLNEEDNMIRKQLSSLGLLKRDDLVDIALAGMNANEKDLLLKQSFVEIIKELSTASKQAPMYIKYKTDLQALQTKLIKEELAGDYVASATTSNDISDLMRKWAAHVNNILDYDKRLTPEEEREKFNKMEADAKAGNLTGINFAEKYDVTPTQAILLLVNQTRKKLYTSPIFGVGLQQKAEVQRLGAYGIGYLRAVEQGYNQSESHNFGVRNVERAHALYDNAHKQKGANTKGGKLMFMYSTYKYNAFKKFSKTFKDAVPQYIKHRHRLTSWSDWPQMWKNIKALNDSNIELTEEAKKGMMILKDEKGKVGMKDSNLSGFLASRMAIGLVSAQIGATLLRGLGNSDDPVTQSFFDIVNATIKMLNGSDDKYLDQEVIWSMQSTIFWAGLPQMMALSTPITAAMIDWETAASSFRRGRFGLQMRFLTQRLPNEIQSIGHQWGWMNKLDKDDIRLIDPRALDKMLGIKLLGYTKTDNGWMNYEQRFPMLGNPFNWMPFVEPQMYK